MLAAGLGLNGPPACSGSPPVALSAMSALPPGPAESAISALDVPVALAVPLPLPLSLPAAAVVRGNVGIDVLPGGFLWDAVVG